MKVLLAFFFSLMNLAAFAQVCESKGPNVILFTLDGVRSHEFFKGTDSSLARQLPRSERGDIFSRKKGMILGIGDRYQIASSIAVSLPSYQALMVGHATDCKNNSCAKINEISVLESVRQALDLPKKDVAAFASWEGLSLAVAKDPTQITHGIFPEILSDF